MTVSSQFHKEKMLQDPAEQLRSRLHTPPSSESRNYTDIKEVELVCFDDPAASPLVKGRYNTADMCIFEYLEVGLYRWGADPALSGDIGIIDDLTV
ncbi:hypothetical protein ES707_17814 [subsurface metagenome]